MAPSDCRARITIALALVAVAADASAQGPAPSLADRARGAERVIVGDVTSTTPVWRVNEYGDRLIVTVLHVAARETLKGIAQPVVDVEVEGGSLDGLTLAVSDLPAFARGDRAVFYLRRSGTGSLVPHLRGDGLLRLDRADRVVGTALTLADVRQAVTVALRPQQ